MQVLITGKGIQLTPAIEAYIEKKILGLDKFFDGIVRANIIVGLESHHHQKGDIFFAECRLEVRGNDLFASKTEITLYKAIDKVRDYMEGELKHYKAKMKGNEQKNRRLRRENKGYNE